MGTLRWRIGSQKRKESIVDGIRMGDTSANRDRMRLVGVDGVRIGEAANSGISGGSTYNTDLNFYGTHEPIDNDTLLADDFTRGYQVSGGGAWYTYTADDVIPNLGTYNHPGVMNWRGTIANGRPSPTPAGAAVNLGGGFWCATSGVVGTAPGVETANMADHNVRYATDEAWIRFYTKPSADYVVGAEKMVTLNATTAGSGGISIGGAGSGGGTGAAWTVCPVYECNVLGTVYYRRQNIGPVVLTIPGRWQFVEMHMKLNTPGVSNGIWELWLDDCGAGVLPVHPGPTPTKKAEHFDVLWQSPAENDLLRSIWFENWSNPTSTGSYKYTGWINCNRAHALGFSTLF